MSEPPTSEPRQFTEVEIDPRYLHDATTCPTCQSTYAALDTLSQQAAETVRELRWQADHDQRHFYPSRARRWRGLADELEAALPERARRDGDEPDPTEGLPDDLKRVLRDQSIVVPQDQGVFERIAEGDLWKKLREWQDAPSNTAPGEPRA